MYERLHDLDDPERPWRRIYRCNATGVFVKAYVKRVDAPLGQLRWDITASACDENGGGAGDAVLGGRDEPQRHVFQDLAERAPDEIEPLADRLERDVLFMVARVERAVLVQREAAGL